MIRAADMTCNRFYGTLFSVILLHEQVAMNFIVGAGIVFQS
jgi:hypothetical protein